MSISLLLEGHEEELLDEIRWKLPPEMKDCDLELLPRRTEVRVRAIFPGSRMDVCLEAIPNEELLFRLRGIEL
jgi:hypothetical protein